MLAEIPRDHGVKREQPQRERPSPGELQPSVYCDCGEVAMMRIENKNCCPRCYAKSHGAPRSKMVDNPVCNEIRAAYAKSRAAPAGQITEFIEREPGEEG